MMIWNAPPPLETSPEERAERVNLLRPINDWFWVGFHILPPLVSMVAVERVFRSPGVGLFAPSQPVVRPGPPRFAPESGFSPHLAQAAFLYGLTSTGNAPRLTPLERLPIPKEFLWYNSLRYLHWAHW